MKFEFNDLKELSGESKIKYLDNKIKSELLINILENRPRTPLQQFIFEYTKFSLWDKDIGMMSDRMTDETLNKITSIYEIMRIELESILAEAEEKEY